MITRPFFTDGGKLVINARCNQGGAIRVAAADGKNTALPGFAPEDCPAMDSDATAHDMAWKANNIIPEGWVALYFHIENADLFTFRIVKD